MPDLIVRLAAIDEAADVSAVLREAVERHAAAHGFATVVLSTTPFLDLAIALYERCGFRRTDAGPLDLAGTPLFTMEKILEWNR